MSYTPSPVPLTQKEAIKRLQELQDLFNGKGIGSPVDQVQEVMTANNCGPFRAIQIMIEGNEEQARRSEMIYKLATDLKEGSKHQNCEG